MMRPKQDLELVVVGASAGGVRALEKLLGALPSTFPLPILITQHLAPNNDDLLSQVLSYKCGVDVLEAVDKQPLERGRVFLAPPNYHLLVENCDTLALSADEKIHHSRPSIDVLFTSAADVFRNAVLGILLTGAGKDGTQGLRDIREAGGLTIAQSPAEAEFPEMPQAAVEAGAADYVLPLQEIIAKLEELAGVI